jgi:hypothetical protein
MAVAESKMIKAEDEKVKIKVAQKLKPKVASKAQESPAQLSDQEQMIMEIGKTHAARIN